MCSLIWCLSPLVPGWGYDFVVLCINGLWANRTAGHEPNPVCLLGTATPLNLWSHLLGTVNNHTYIIPHHLLLWLIAVAFGNFGRFEYSWDAEPSTVLLLGAVNVVQVLFRGGFFFFFILCFGLLLITSSPPFYFISVNKLFLSWPMGFTILFSIPLGSGKRVSSHMGVSCHLCLKHNTGLDRLLKLDSFSYRNAWIKM